MKRTGEQQMNTQEQAREAGYTLRIFAVNNLYSLSLLVKPSADLEGIFRAFCTDENEYIKVDGWHFHISEAAQ
jgi:hypothetical protein